MRRGLGADALLQRGCIPAVTLLRGSSRSPTGSEGWYGSNPEWKAQLERGLVREHPGQVTVASHDPGCFQAGSTSVRVYTHSGLDVPGRADRVPVRIEFHERPPYSMYGLPPQDYPRVFADPKAESKHRMPDDDALCLYYPADRPERRWTAADGLVALWNIVRNHLFCELHWRHTGGHVGGEWLLDEAEHGFQQKDVA